MTAEQLQHARASAWCHDGHALLTGDEAAAWLRSAGLALFSPRPAQIAAPAGSFVEATLGEASPTPSLHAMEAASGLLRRMLATASGAADAVALRLLEGPGGSLGLPSDQPDFLATEETLPFVFALRGDREWRRGPRGKSSPLVVEVWKLLDRDGAQTADELKDKLGRHLTESAALRALTELWTTLRIEPLYGAGGTGDGPTHWQLLEANHERAMTAGSAMAQGMALSALVSVYLQSAIAATGDEIEAFLSPLASRSRIREAVRGLHATRQLGVRHLGANEHFFVEGSLPGFGDELPRALPQAFPKVLGDMLPETPGAFAMTAAQAEPEPAGEAPGGLRIDALSDAETERERAAGDGRKRFVAGRASSSGERRSFGPAGAGAKGPGGPRKTFGAKTYGGNTFGGTSSGGGSFGGKSDGARKSFGATAGSFGKRAPFRPTNGPSNGLGSGPGAGALTNSTPDGAAKPFFAREPWKEDGRPSEANRQGSPGPEKREFRPERRAPLSERGKPRWEQRPVPFARGEREPSPGGSFRSDTDRRPFAPRSAGPNRTGSGPNRTGTDGGARPPRKTFAPRTGEDRPTRASFPSRDGAARPSTPREGARPSTSGARKSFAPRDDGRPDASRPDRKPFAARSGDLPGRPFTPRDGSKSSAPRGDRQPFLPREGSRPFSPRSDRKPFAPREDTGTDRTPFAPREGKPPAARVGGRPFSPRGDRKPFVPREGGAPVRRTFAPRTGAPEGAGERRGFAPRDRDGAPRGAGSEASGPPRRAAAEGGPSARPGGAAGKRPRTAPFTSSGKPRPGVSAAGRPGPRSGPRAGRPGKPASGRKPGAPPRKPGGQGPGKSPGRGPGRGAGA